MPTPTPSSIIPLKRHRPPLTATQIFMVFALMREDRSRQYIAVAVGCGVWTVTRYTAGLLRERFLARQRARADRLLQAYDDTDSTADRRELAGRFGYASVASMQIQIFRLRQRMNAAT